MSGCWGMNMSVGAIGSTGNRHHGYLLPEPGANAWLAVPIVLLFGLIAGLINGLIITKLKINSFMRGVQERRGTTCGIAVAENHRVLTARGAKVDYTTRIS